MINLSSTDTGSGEPILLIHGFPFHQLIWEEYVGRLSDSFRVLTVDLPGFGKSPSLPSPFSLGQVADTLLSFIASKNLNALSIVGHSLGGYVALAMVEKRPELFSSLVLFHSTAYADSDEKKESRTKVIDFVRKNGALPFTSGFIPPLFADPTHPAIKKVTEIASQATAEAVIGYTVAMRERKDQIKTLESFKNPTLFLAGESDPGIPVDSIRKQAASCQKPEIHIFEKVAHMGMFEKPAETASKIKGFVMKSNT
ncbi:alpha/beta hydrolase [Chryseolinea sp. H1M3-3]|uniref:alpha/beta fold hydrolase n=1 Tax=Chryseolinea sp. H1M3-3 TaxID=3034144 RepID=UPI0023EC1453|nr:alpha/beta hydrolase [Chryseolinea sp. H1M3-3]